MFIDTCEPSIDIGELSIDTSKLSTRSYEGGASAGIEAIIEIIVADTLDNSCCCYSTIITSESRRS